MTQESEIQSFFRESHVLVTGGTGFLGKMLVEKLLYSCPGLAKIYLIIRCKKGKSEEARLQELLDDIVFTRIRETCPERFSKIVMVPGDCSLTNLGVTNDDKALLLDNITQVFHGAATVRFDENLKLAVAINVNGTKQVIEMCRQMKNLKAFVHTSTAYSNSNLEFVDEKFYEPPSCNSRLCEIANVLTQEEIEKITPDLLKPWPNTYSFTKAVAEHLVKHEEDKLPACVFRPAAVTSSAQEPMPGWIDNVYGPVGLTIGAGLGLVRVIHANRNMEANIVPVDMTVNGIITAATATHKAFTSGNKEIKIYNYVSTNDNPIIWNDYQKLLEEEGQKCPTEKAIWYISLTLCKYYSVYWVLNILLHFLPAIIIDFGAICIGKKPQLVKAYQKIYKFSQTLSFFANTRFKFASDNVRQLINATSEEDKKMFNMDLKTLNWRHYLSDYIAGARIYIVKDPMTTVPNALIRWRRLYWAHQAVKTAFVFLLAKFTYSLVC